MLGSSQGSSCQESIYFTTTNLDVTPYPPVKGTASVITLTGKALAQMTLMNWDLYWYMNGAIVQQVDEVITGTYAVNTPVVLTYTLNIPQFERSGYYNMKLVLQTSQGYYVSCWQFNYYLVGEEVL